MQTGLGDNDTAKQLLKRQSRRMLLYGILFAAVVLSIVFMYAPISIVPKWLYATFGVIGGPGAIFSWSFLQGITKNCELIPDKK